MIGKIVNNHVIIEGEAVYAYLDRGFGSKFLPATITPSNHLSISQSTNENDSNSTMMIISTSSSSSSSPLSSSFSSTNKRGRQEEKKEEEEKESKIPDFLLLKDEEAYYIASRGRLYVCNEKSQVISNIELWRMFVANTDSFPALYKTYEFFKELGYVVKGGINYGVDFTIYRTTPLWCHSEICVLVMDSRKQSSEAQESISWNRVCAQTRITQDVMKTLMMCYVVRKSSESAERSSNHSVNTTNNNSNNNNNDRIDWTDSTCLHYLEVRPLIVTNRRHNVLNEKYMDATELQSKFATASILKRPRQLLQAKKVKQVKVKPVLVAIKKKQSKHNKVWKSLLQPTTMKTITQSDNSHE